MSKHKSATKDKEKSGQLVIRVDKSDRATFIAHCEKLDTTAAREIRRFMREFIGSGSGKDAGDLENHTGEPAGPATEAVAGSDIAPLALIVSEPVLPGGTPTVSALAQTALAQTALAQTAPVKKTRSRAKP